MENMPLSKLICFQFQAYISDASLTNLDDAFEKFTTPLKTLLTDLNAQCDQAEQRRLASKSECEDVQSNRINIESILEAEANELKRVAELER